MTTEVIIHITNNLCLHIVSIHINFYQSLFTNESGRKKNVKIPELHRQSFFEINITTYVLANKPSF